MNISEPLVSWDFLDVIDEDSYERLSPERAKEILKDPALDDVKKDFFYIMTLAGSGGGLENTVKLVVMVELRF